MPLTKPNQQLRRDLKEAAALLKWSGVDVMQVATRLSEAGLEDDAQKLMKIALSLQETEDKLVGLAEEVTVARVVRGKTEHARAKHCLA